MLSILLSPNRSYGFLGVTITTRIVPHIDHFLSCAIYLGQPYEVDANQYAYERVRRICGDSDDVRKLYEFWMPSQPVPDDVYDSVYALIDEKIQMKD